MIRRTQLLQKVSLKLVFVFIRIIFQRVTYTFAADSALTIYISKSSSEATVSQTYHNSILSKQYHYPLQITLSPKETGNCPMLYRTINHKFIILALLFRIRPNPYYWYQEETSLPKHYGKHSKETQSARLTSCIVGSPNLFSYFHIIIAFDMCLYYSFWNIQMTMWWNPLVPVTRERIRRGIWTKG